MKHLTPALAAFLVVVGVSPAAAQTPAPAGSGSATLSLPRVELGGGFTAAVPLSTDSEGFGILPMANARGGVALNARWALEGAFDFWPDSNGFTSVYRAQVRRQLKGDATPGSLRTHLTFGAAGWFSHRSYPGYRWQEASGAMYVYPKRSYWSAGPPMYPTVGVGVQKTLGAHLALRADLAAIVIPYDDGAAVVVMPSISVSTPIGRYPARTQGDRTPASGVGEVR
jgi:hypothetical protein